MIRNPIPWPNGARCAACVTFDMDALLAWVFWFVLSALILERLVLQRLVDYSFRWRREVAT